MPCQIAAMLERFADKQAYSQLELSRDNTDSQSLTGRLVRTKYRKPLRLDHYH